ncbi:hypothetical protein D3C78_1341250 [compost metagenome]
MFGCCKFPQATFRVSYDSPPDIERLRKLFGDVVRIEERDIATPRPHRKWVLVKPDGKDEEVCTCPCHCDEGIAVLC